MADVRLRAYLTVLVAVACQIPGAAQSELQTIVHASGLSQPVAVVQDPTNRSVQFVVQQGGRIRVVQNGMVLAADFLDVTAEIVSGGEQGLLGLAFAPDYAQSGRFYIHFTNRSGNHVIARFRRSSDPLVADGSTRFDLKWNGSPVILQPFANHNGGHLAFGPDGFLYIGLGDGGSGNDPGHRAQNPAELLGKMLRIDVNVPDDDASGYQVPPDNPFVGSGPPGTRPEIWAFGLRNPWRYTFDDPSLGGTGALIIGDVGQNAFEEIDYEPPGRGGRNYGWRNREGAHNNVTSLPAAFLPLTEPVFEYNRSLGGSITGGYVYRGRELGASFQGRYFFADYVSGRLWSLGLSMGGDGETQFSNLMEHTVEVGGPFGVSSFGVDAFGELFVANHQAGTILRLVGPPVAPPTPEQLNIIR
jgi:glucose/arabinose dehydrogenase